MNRFDHAEQEHRPEPGNVRPMTENVVRSTLETRRVRRPHLQLGVLVLAVALAAFVVVWLLLRDGHKTTIPAPNAGPTLVSQAQLEHLADSVDHPVYWAGPKDAFSYELTQTTDGRIFIRYLPRGVKAGDRRPDFLVVGTYSQPHSFVELKRAAKREGSVSVGIANGGLVVFNSKKPTSVYFGYPDAKYQVEVFTPSGETARSLVLTGQIKPIR
ncbi:MAG: hypothetical protein M3R26_02535 [Actinomycetota bacterium]|nr:hypothetical protein [Actinomycetota bacterium]MDQ2981187.1 hypothetical protein [Actinomycetota bacterium]